jgi:hypothetical protein
VDRNTLYPFILLDFLLTAREGYRGYTILALFFPLYKSPYAGFILLSQNSCTGISTLSIQFKNSNDDEKTFAFICTRGRNGSDQCRGVVNGL